MVGFVALILVCREKIRTGHGGESYRTGHGYQFNHVGALVLIVHVPAVMLVGSAIGWWQRRDERDFERKYSRRPR